MKKKNKKGWIKVVEAFLAIIFLVSVIFMVIGNDRFKKIEPSLVEEKAYEVLLRLQVNNTLRHEVVTETNFDIDSNDTGFSVKIKKFLDSNKFSEAECYTKICDSMLECSIDKDLRGNVFVAEILITNSISIYSPKKVKMFCLEK